MKRSLNGGGGDDDLGSLLAACGTPSPGGDSKEHLGHAAGNILDTHVPLRFLHSRRPVGIAW